MSGPLALISDRLAAVTASWATAQSLDEIRSSFAAYLAEVGPHGAALAKPRMVDTGLGFDAAWIGNGARKALYIHGGGFQIGSIASHASLIARIAEEAQAEILAIDYRLAPQHRYPAASDDAFAAYQWMLAQGGPPPAIIGDSAGGALALLTAQKARDASLPLPSAIALISPWLDLSMQGESYIKLADQDIFSKADQLRAMARSYLGRNGPEASAPEVSPLWGDLENLPPVLIHSGSADITLDDSVILAERIHAAKGAVELKIFDQMCHHFQIFEALPQAQESLAEIGIFLRNL